MRVRTILIEKALEKRARLKALLEISEETSCKVGKKWIPWQEESLCPKKLLAIDGSRNRKNFAGYVVYAVGACCALFKDGKLIKEDFLTDVDILKPDEFSEERLRLLMGILETKIALKHLSSVEVILLDGSIVGNIIRPVAFELQLSEKEKGKLREIYSQIMQSFSLYKIDSRSAYEELIKIFPEGKFPLLAGYLEYLEYLYSLYKLVNSDKLIISISKSSSTRAYKFDSLLPDITVLNLLNLPSGFSEPLKTKGEDEKFKLPPVEFSDELLSKEFYIFFFKLPKSKVVYKCETNTPDVKKVLAILNYFNINGYPFPLKEVHNKIKIQNSDIEEILKVLKHKGISGREAIE